jgi:hypothetical protein
MTGQRVRHWQVLVLHAPLAPACCQRSSSCAPVLMPGLQDVLAAAQAAPIAEQRLLLTFANATSLELHAGSSDAAHHQVVYGSVRAQDPPMHVSYAKRVLSRDWQAARAWQPLRCLKPQLLQLWQLELAQPFVVLAALLMR